MALVKNLTTELHTRETPKESTLPGVVVQKKKSNQAAAPVREQTEQTRLPGDLAEEQKRKKAAADLFLELTQKKPNDYMMANANAGYAREQLGRTEQEYEGFLAANQNSSSPPVNLPEALGLQEKAAEWETQADYWENQKSAIKHQQIIQKDIAQFEQWPEEDKKLMEQYSRGRNLMPLDIGATIAHQKLVNKYGLEALNRMEESYSRSRNQEKTQEVAEFAEKSTTGFLGKTGSAVLARGANLIGNTTGAMDTAYAFANDLISGTGRYSGLDPNLAGNLPFVYANTVDSKIAEDMKKKGWFGEAGALMYQGGTSAIDSALRLGVAGETGALALAGMGSFSQTVSQASAQGATPGQAVMLGIIDGALEVGTEKLSLDKLLGDIGSGKKTAGQILKLAAGQAGVEVAEEELSWMGSALAEAAILREKSSTNQRIGELVTGGMSYDEAVARVDRELMAQAMQTAAVSAFSGGGMSVAASVGNNLRAGNQKSAGKGAAEPVAQLFEKPNRVEAIRETAGQGPQEAESGIPAAEQSQQEIIDLIADSALQVKQKRQADSQEAARKTGGEYSFTLPKFDFGVDATADLHQMPEGQDSAAQERKQPEFRFDRSEIFGKGKGEAAPEDTAGTEQQTGHRYLAEDFAFGRMKPDSAAEAAAPLHQMPEEVNPEQEQTDAQLDRSDAIREAADLVAGTADGTYAIKENMPDMERYETLKNRQIHVVTAGDSGEHAAELNSLASLQSRAKSKAEKIIKPLAVKLGILKRNMSTPDVDVEFRFTSSGGLSESLHKQLRYGGNYSDFAKAMINMDKILQSATLIEKHGDKYAGTSRASENLESVYVLFGAFRDGNNVIPVQMEIKKTSDSGSRLYMMVTMTKIEADVLGSAPGNGQTPSLISASKYNIADIFGKINPQDAHFLKYLPDQFLNEEQSKAKYAVLEEDNRRIQQYRNEGNKKGSTATPESVQADSFTPEATGGTAPNSEDVTQVSADDLSANRRTNAQSELASPSPGASINGQGGNVNRAMEEPKGSVAAKRGFSGTAAYDELLYDGNIQRSRKGDARNVEVPVTDASGNRVSEFVGNSMNSQLTSDRFTDTIKKLVTDEQLSHEVQTNEESLRMAAQSIEEDGEIYDSVQKVKKVAESGKTGTNDIAKALLLYQHLTDQVEQQIREKGEADRYTQSLQSDAYVSLAQLATNTGRSLQLFSLFRKMTPEYQAKVLQKEVSREIEKLQKQGVVKKNYQAQISPELLQEYRNAAEENRKAKSDGEKTETEQKMKEIQNAIYMSEAAKLPATFKAKWGAWRYMAMLGNVKTQVRNIAGNVSFAPYVAAKNTVGTLAEMALIRDRSKRTKAFVGLSKSDRALWNWAIADTKSENTRSILKGTAKLGDDTSKGALTDNMRVFKSGVLENARKLVNGVTEGGDMLFKNPYYTSNLVGFIKARGYTAEDIQSGKMPQSVLNDARAYAVNEAMKATFNDSNVFSDFMSSMGRKNTDNWIGKAANIALEGVMPFRKTPANIVVRFSDYSVGGLVKGVWNAAKCINDGGASAATAIDSLASGMTGTGMAVLGYFLASGMFGFRITGSGVDEDEERQGHQKYAVEFSIDGRDYSYSIDWAAPANLPLFVGANLYEAWKEADENPTLSKFTSTIYGMATSFEPLLELSCMSSLNDIFEAGKYADNDALYAVVAQAATSYLTQGIPALARQTAQATREHKQQTFANSSDPLIRDLQRKAGNIPFAGAALQMDKVDAWGKPESRGNVAERILNAYFNPGTLKQIDNSEVEREITRLNEVQPESVSPPDTPKTISYTDSNGKYHKDHRLTEDEYDALARTQGQTAKRILDDLVGSKDYEALSDSQKAKVFSLVYDYAREKGREKAIPGYDRSGDGWMEGVKVKHEGKAIIRKVTEDSISGSISDLTEAWKKGWDDDQAADSLKDAYKAYGAMSYQTRAKIRTEATGKTHDFLAAAEAGVEPETFTKLYKTYYGINSGDEKPARKAENWAYELQKAKERGTITPEQLEVLKKEMTISSGFTVETEKFDQMAEEGISADKAKYVADLMAGIEPETGYTAVRNVQKYEEIATSNLSEREKDAVMKIYMPDYDPKDKQPDKTELKYDYARQEMGLSAEEYVEAYRAYTQNDGKKAEMIAAWMALGFTWEEANNLYLLFAASGNNKIDVVQWYENQ